MDKEQKGLLLLIKSIFTGKNCILPDEIDLKKVFSLANAHALTSLVYEGAYNSGVLKKNAFSQKLFSIVCKDMVANESQVFAFKEIAQEFEKNSIAYMPLKGIRLKNLYPKPEMRTMGDIDILIKLEQYESIKNTMLSLGYKPVLESDHEFIWNRNLITIELHKRLIPSYNKDYYKYFGEGWDLALKKHETGFEYVLKKEDELIFLFTHLCKHYRDSGIGIKHVLDIWLFINKYPDIDNDYVKMEMMKLKIYEFYQNVLKMLAVWFDDVESDEKTEYLTDVIFNGGAFKTDEAKVLSATLKEVKEGKTVKQIKKKRFITAIFTPYKYMCDYYPFLRKCKILLPLMWVYHFFRRLFTKGKLKNYNRQMSEMNEKDIELYQKSLNYVGLDFNFEKETEE